MNRHIPTHFSQVIQDQFNERAVKNPSYSLRAFARDLGVLPSALSEILRKKKGISLKSAGLIGKKMGLLGDDLRFFKKLVEANCARKESDRKKAKAELLQFDTRYTELQGEQFRLISDWHHFAIFDLVKIKDFKSDPEWIARRLGISSKEASLAIDRLIRFNILQELNGQLIQARDFLVVPAGNAEASRRLHEQIMTRGIKAIRTQSVSERHFVSGHLRIRKSDVPKIGEKIREFTRTITQEAETGDEHDHVYSYGIQFFKADTPI